MDKDTTAVLPAPTRVEHPWPKRMLRTLQFGLARLASRDGFVTARAAPFDLTFKGPAADVITRHIYRLGAHEPVITRYLLEHVRLGPADIALDIGANLGWYSVLLNRLSAPGARIFAFEPDPQTYQLLRANLEANQATRVTGLNIALGETPGSAQLRRYKDSNNGRHSLIPGDDIAGTVTVEVDTLERFWSANALGDARLAFMKVDVEGFEYFVLRGAGALLGRCAHVLLEYSPHSLVLAGRPADALIKLLAASGLTARAFVNGRLEPVSFADLAQAHSQLDLLLSPPARARGE
jgi:FkbM family methyltransferase